MVSDLLPDNLKGAVVELVPYLRGQSVGIIVVKILLICVYLKLMSFI